MVILLVIPLRKLLVALLAILAVTPLTGLSVALLITLMLPVIPLIGFFESLVLPAFLDKLTVARSVAPMIREAMPNVTSNNNHR
ncbi:MAG TPA: hypothetical protein VL122_12515 [Nitrospirota bacterium]|nr:hypothetical protein [Nitrospirota bacterium]